MPRQRRRYNDGLTSPPKIEESVHAGYDGVQASDVKAVLLSRSTARSTMRLVLQKMMVWSSSCIQTEHQSLLERFAQSRGQVVYPAFLRLSTKSGSFMNS